MFSASPISLTGVHALVDPLRAGGGAAIDTVRPRGQPSAGEGEERVMAGKGLLERLAES
jgi:hypothetical protein